MYNEDSPRFYMVIVVIVIIIYGFITLKVDAERSNKAYYERQSAYEEGHSIGYEEGYDAAIQEFNIEK